MSIKIMIKQFLDPITKLLLPHYIKFDQNRNDRPGALFKAWGHVLTNHIRGGYYEFGIYKGESFRESYRIYQDYVVWMDSQSKSPEMWRRKIKWEHNHHFYAFDTFEGMPDYAENEETFAKGTFLSTLEEVKLAGRRKGMLEGEAVRYFKGIFSEIARYNAEEIDTLQPAAIVNIDCDLYASASDALEMVKPKLQQGTILMMDDWNCFSADRNKGERRALKEFLEKNLEFEVESYFPYSHTGQAFIIHLKDSTS